MSPLHFANETRTVFVVSKFDATRKFYEEILELRIVDEWSREGKDRGVIYAIGNTVLEVLESDTQPVAEGFYLYMEVQDIDALWAELSTKADVINPIATQPWKHRNFSIRDPNGFKLKFFSKIA